MKSTLSKTYSISLNVNGISRTLHTNANETLLELLREKLNLTSVKRSCDMTGQCGACTVILDRKAVNSCLVLAIEADGKRVLTVEGLSSDGELHPLQKAFLRYGGLQCGFCTPGMIMSALALLNENPNPTTDDIKDALQGNICRCTGYVKILEAINSVVGKHPRE